jgi:hypothetical protein
VWIHWLALSCPSCTVGQGLGEFDSVLLVGALILIPVAVAAVAGLAIARLVRRRPE